MWTSADVSDSVDHEALVSMTDLFIHVSVWDRWGVDVGAKGRAGVEVICVQGVTDPAADWAAVVPTENKEKRERNSHFSIFLRDMILIKWKEHCKR